MHDIYDFLTAVTVVLCVAAVTTVLFQKLRQPVVLGYVLAGLIVGPHVPIPLVADPKTVTTLSELGVILLMFSLGLEFSLRKLARIGSTAGIIGVIQCSILVWAGFTTGRLFGWTTMESLFLGAIIAISSTTIIAKVFQEQGITGHHRELVVGVLIVEDLIGILFMALFTGIASGAGLETGPLLLTIGKLLLFLGGVIVAGLFLVPGMMRTIEALDRKETTLVASIGFCFALALLAHAFGYSVALGAFLAGSLIAESGHQEKVEHLVEPVRDMFAAIFFVSVGMTIDPAVILAYKMEIAILTVVVITVKFAGVSVGAFLTGAGLRTSVKAGLSMAQIGEFSFIIAALGIATRATGEFIYPITVAISAITTLTTPMLISASGPAANWFDRKLPKPLQTFAALYGSWIEELRSSADEHTPGPIRRSLRRLFVDAVVLTGIIIGTALGRTSLVAMVRSIVPLPDLWISVAIVLLAVFAGAPFALGIIRLARKLGIAFARRVMPAQQKGRIDLVAAPRRMFVVTLQIICVLLVGAPVLAFTQPFLPSVPVASVVITGVIVLAVIFWRTAADLQGHVRAGAEVVAAAIKRRQHGNAPADPNATLKEVHTLLPGLGDLETVELTKECAAVGRTLKEINLRGVSGATVLAISRGEEGVTSPTATEQLREGDVLALSGSHEAVETAKRYLTKNEGE